MHQRQTVGENVARWVVPFEKIDLTCLPEVGGKNASLGEMIQRLGDAGVPVPPGFAITCAAYFEHLERSDLKEFIQRRLEDLDVNDVGRLMEVSREIRQRIRQAPLPRQVADAIEKAYDEISSRAGTRALDVAVRSSATAEDLPDASFAGQQDTYLNVQGKGALLDAVRDCMASLFNSRAIVYRAERDIDHHDVGLSVGVQQMVRSDLASAGVIFTLDTETGFRDVVLVTGSWGLGETVVQGRVNPDEFWVHKPTLLQGFSPIIQREKGDKALELVYAEGHARRVRERAVAEERRQKWSLSSEEVLALSRYACLIEEHYSARQGRPTPMDIEWAKDGVTGKLFILQARPETVHSVGAPELEVFTLRGDGPVLVTGKSVGESIGAGPVRVARTVEQLHDFQDGDVLVAPMTDPDWEPVLRKAAAVVTDQGGRTCHAAIVSRELGVPCIVGTENATQVLSAGREVTVSCAGGAVGKVFDGRIEFEREVIRPETLPEPRVPVMLNVGNPELAFRLGQLPSAGVGLARMEFVVGNWIGVHPLALLHPDRIRDAGVRKEVLARAAAWDSPAEFFVERLASGIARIAAGFYPRPVIVRFSDFKTNEYAGLLGGVDFEPREANPMIGFRGASRYYSESYREGFGLECEAIRRVRKDMGLTNVKVMVPFCRTLDEGRRVIDEMTRNGLERGAGGLELYVMCEIPNNVILAEEFAEMFDGFSIGSNDLTQLTLGVDRDSETLAHVFDEQDPGVKKMVRMVIAGAHRKGRKVGLCGQGPSDHPEYAEFLLEAGIDSISVTPDALPRVLERVAERKR